MKKNKNVELIYNDRFYVVKYYKKQNILYRWDYFDDIDCVCNEFDIEYIKSLKNDKLTKYFDKLKWNYNI